MAARNCPSERDLIGVLERTADGQTVSDSRDDCAQRLELALYVHCGRFTLRGGGGGKDDLERFAFVADTGLNTFDQAANLELFRPNAIHR